MGIRDLYDLIREVDTEQRIMYPITLEHIAGQSVAIDMGHVLHAFYAAAARSYVTDCINNHYSFDRDDVETICIANILHHLYRIAALDIKIYAIFDGKTPPLKQGVREARDKKKAVSETRYYNALNILDTGEMSSLSSSEVSEIVRAVSSYVHITEEFKNKVIFHVRGVGVGVMEATYEADLVCGILASNYFVDHVMTKDGDLLVHGTPSLIKYEKKKGFSHVNLHPLLDAIGMEFEEFQALCIYAGCDYNTGIPRCRMKTLMNLRRRFGTIFEAAKNSGYNFSVARLEECLTMFNPEGELEDHVKCFDLTIPRHVSVELVESIKDARIDSAVSKFGELWQRRAGKA